MSSKRCKEISSDKCTAKQPFVECTAKQPFVECKHSSSDESIDKVCDMFKGYINLKNGNTLAVQCVYGDINCTEIPGSYYSSEIIALSDRFTLHDWNRSFRSIT